LNICLVLDTSTSMKGPRLDSVKTTASSLIRSLQPDDYFSLVSFNDRAEVVVPAGRGHDLKKVESQISILRTSGGTEMLPGLEEAMEQINRNHSQSHLNHIIMVTDGRTYGDEAECLQLADSANRMGITITALGIGHEWNDEFLDDLTRRTGGSCTYASQPDKVKQILEEKFGAMSYTYATNLCLEYTTLANVEMRYAFRLSPDPSSICSDEMICIGNLPVKQNLSILMEFYIHELEPNASELVLAEGTLHITVPSRAIPKSSSKIRLSRPIVDEPDTTPPPQMIIKAMSSLSLYRLQERAQAEINEGKMEIASQHLNDLANQLLGSGQRDLAKTVALELENVKIGDPVSEEGKKRIKYGTRSLVMSDEVEKLI
jgi:Ca-activated chloride channel family protein